MARPKTKKVIINLFCLSVALFLAVMTVPASSVALDSTQPADTSPPDGVDMEGPAFSNPAQAQHAENLAFDAAAHDEATAAALDALDEVEKSLEAAKATGDEAKIAEALEACEKARELAEATFAETAGTLQSDIASMREAGMGWGQIAHELGVHPGVLGLGHSRHNQLRVSTTARISHEERLALSFGDITARNMKTGKSDSRGQNCSGKGLGTGKAGEKGSSSKGGNHNGSNGNGNGKGGGGNGRGK